MSVPLDSAIEIVRNIFDNSSETSATLRDVYLKLGRDLQKDKENKQWFSNKLSQMKEHNLLLPVYGQRNHRKVLDGVKLSREGLVLLASLRPSNGQAQTLFDLPSSSPSPSPSPSASADAEEPMGQVYESNATVPIVSLEEAMRTIAGFKVSHPEYEVEFNVKLKSTN